MRPDYPKPPPARELLTEADLDAQAALWKAYWEEVRAWRRTCHAIGYCTCKNGQSWAGKPDPGCPVHDLRVS